MASLPCSRSWLERIAGAGLFPFAGELQGALADPPRRTEGLVGGEGVEPFGLRLALVAQEVNKTQCLTLRSQLRCPRPRVPNLHRKVRKRTQSKSGLRC